MEEPQHLVDARTDAMVTILSQISQRLGDGLSTPPVGVLALAEAYAWLHSPDQPHGARTQPLRPGATGGVA